MAELTVHPEAAGVLAAVEGFRERVERRAAFRASDGRRLSADNVRDCRELADALRRCAAALDALVGPDDLGAQLKRFQGILIGDGR